MKGPRFGGGHFSIGKAWGARQALQYLILAFKTGLEQAVACSPHDPPVRASRQTWAATTTCPSVGVNSSQAFTCTVCNPDSPVRLALLPTLYR